MISKNVSDNAFTGNLHQPSKNMNFKDATFQYKCVMCKKSEHNRVSTDLSQGMMRDFPEGSELLSQSFYNNLTCLTSNKMKFTKCSLCQFNCDVRKKNFVLLRYLFFVSVCVCMFSFRLFYEFCWSSSFYL